MRKSGELFNVQGYKATSLSDITGATGLTKGAIYRHFGNKEELERAAAEDSFSRILSALRGAVAGRPTAAARLEAAAEFFRAYVADPIVSGGCPLLNTAVEADDGDPALRKAAERFLDVLQHSIERIVRTGAERGEFRSGVDGEAFSSVFIATLEGAVMMSRLRGTDSDIAYAVDRVKDLVASIAARAET